MSRGWDTDLLTVHSPSEISVRSASGATANVELVLEPGYSLVEDAAWSNGIYTIGMAAHQVDEDVVTICLPVRNISDRPQRLPAVTLRMTGPDPLAYIDGPYSYVAFRVRDSGEYLTLTPRGGAHIGIAARDGITVTTTNEDTLAPDGFVRFHWVALRHTTAISLIRETLPPWYPEYPVTVSGQAVELDFLDGIIEPGNARIASDYPLVELKGPDGRQVVTLSEAAGRTNLEVGWAKPLSFLVHSALQGPLPDDLRAWFRSWQVRPPADPTNQEIDELDVIIAQALENPTPFAVAAAADCVPLFGRPMLREAFDALVKVGIGKDFEDGVYLAALRLYSQALAQSSPIADEVSALLANHSSPGSEEWLLLGPGSDVEQVVSDLSWRIGMGLPGQSTRPTGHSVALLEAAFQAHPELAFDERFEGLDHVSHLGELWVRCSCGPRELAWLLW